MSTEQIKIILDGLPEDDGDVLLAELVTALSKLRAALAHTNQHLTGKNRAVLHVSHLSHNSPAAATIENRNDTVGLINTFGKALDCIGEGKAASLIGYSALEDISEITKRVQLGRVGSISINGTDHNVVSLDADFSARLQQDLIPMEACTGTIEGILEALNIHAGANRFTIFPVSAEQGITCIIPAKLHDKTLAAVRCKVAVTGELKYRPDSMLPFEVLVDDIQAFQPDKKLPSFNDLRGIAPDMTGDKSTEEYLAELRDAWN